MTDVGTAYIRVEIDQGQAEAVGVQAGEVSGAAAGAGFGRAFTKDSTNYVHDNLGRVLNSTSADIGKASGSRFGSEFANETTASVKKSSSGLSQILEALFSPHSLRSFRGELKGTLHDLEGGQKSLGGFAKAGGLLAGGFIATSLAAPLITRAFSALSKPADALDKALFGAADRIKETRSQIAGLASDILKDFNASTFASISGAVDALNLKLAQAVDAARAAADAGTSSAAKQISLVLSQAGGDLTSAPVEQLAHQLDVLVNTGLLKADAATKQFLASVQAANTGTGGVTTLKANVDKLAASMGVSRSVALATAKTIGVNLSVALGDAGLKTATLQGNQLLLGEALNNIITASTQAGQAVQLVGAVFGNAIPGVDGLANAVARLLDILGQAGHGSITAGFKTVLGDVVKDAGILAKNPLLTQTQASLKLKGLNPDQIASFLSQQKSTLAAIGAGGVGSVGGQQGLYDLNNILNLVTTGGGGGGGAPVLAKLFSLPSSLTRDSIVNALDTATKSGGPAVRKAIARLSDEIRRAVTDPSLAPGRDALIGFVERRGKALATFADSQASLVKRIAKGQGDLNQLRSAQAQFFTQVNAEIAKATDLTGAISGNAPLSPGQVLAFLRSQARQVTQFATTLATLTAEGLNKTTRDSLINSGISGGGLKVANALAAGGQAEVDQVNALSAGIGQGVTATQQLTAADFTGGVSDIVKAIHDETAELARLRRDNPTAAQTGAAVAKGTTTLLTTQHKKAAHKARTTPRTRHTPTRKHHG